MGSDLARKNSGSSSSKDNKNETGIKVMVRVRPLNFSEMENGDKEIGVVLPTQITLKTNMTRSYVFDHVLPPSTIQADVFGNCSYLLDNFLEGYNATILAYGQTGSGKTHTMGSGFSLSQDEESMGIIHRAVGYIFKVLDDRKKKAVEEGHCPPEFSLRVSFLELYNENINDLLGKTDKCSIQEKNGCIMVTGLQEIAVSSPSDIFSQLKTGSLARSTGSTNMNNTSSRSHAIFSIILDQRTSLSDSVDESCDNFLKSKFHFVDLAGSERLKKTKATGDRAKEGISINAGLLALGNVISVLGDPEKKSHHVNYRDSKLTRLLQDSLGGNSRTMMIACVSPAESNEPETKNTLNYASRARNIKNKAIVNYDSNSDILSKMKQEIIALRSELVKEKERSAMAGNLGPHSDNIEKLLRENIKIKAQNRDFNHIVTSFVAIGNCFKKNSEELGENLTAQIKQGIGDMIKISDEVSSSNHKVKEEKQHSPTGNCNTTKEKEETKENSDDTNSMDDSNNENFIDLVESINSGISAKEGLILNIRSDSGGEDLEEVKFTYEKKIMSIEEILKDTENQRNQLLENISSIKQHDQTSKNDSVKMYEQKIKECRNEINQLKKKTTSLAQQLKTKKANEQRINELLRDVREMKKQKIDIVKKMKSDVNKANTQKELQKRALTKLEKESNKDKAKIANLEQQKKQQSEILKRKLAETQLMQKRRKQKGGHYGKDVYRPIGELQSWIDKQILALVIAKEEKGSSTNLKNRKNIIESKLKTEKNEDEKEYWLAELEYVTMQIEALNSHPQEDKISEITNSITDMVQTFNREESQSLLTRCCLEILPLNHIALEDKTKIINSLKKELQNMAVTMAQSDLEDKYKETKKVLEKKSQKILEVEGILNKKVEECKELELKNEQLEQSHHNLIQEIKKNERKQAKKEVQLRQGTGRKLANTSLMSEDDGEAKQHVSHKRSSIVMSDGSEIDSPMPLKKRVARNRNNEEILKTLLKTKSVNYGDSVNNENIDRGHINLRRSTRTTLNSEKSLEDYNNDDDLIPSISRRSRRKRT